MSTFRELFSDYQSKVNEYKEKAQITEPSFMRKFTQGMSIFQEHTSYLEKTAIIRKHEGHFYIPYDLFKVVELGNCNETFVRQDYEQFIRQIQTRHISTTPLFFDARKREEVWNPVHREHHEGTPLYTFWNREILVNRNEHELVMKYYPRLDVFSERSPQWYRTLGDIYRTITANCTFTDATNLVGKDDNDLSDGDIIQFTVINTTTGIVINTDYYVVNKTKDSFQVSATLNGTPIDLVTDGTGTYVRKILTVTGVYYEVLRGSIVLSGTTYTEGQYFLGDGTVASGNGVFQQIDVDNTWFPFDLYFYQRFETRAIHPSLLQYENLFVTYAVARYLQEIINANYLQFDKEFWDGLQIAIANKPLMFSEGRSDYFMPTGSNRNPFENINEYNDWWW